ncbi:hypothetical protein NG745_12595 [Bacillus velezensis]|uniref:hypothetical protein n=1 Tax=Bacillus velezensis TaxID=492670 RepID=UPI00208F51DA|nr:hypothetical protein [Bacillus velezensis]USQ55763.1 hypothetical protein NG745_12595 [Bacillus velezensis]
MTKLAFPAILFIPGIVFAGGNGFSLNRNQLKRWLDRFQGVSIHWSSVSCNLTKNFLTKNKSLLYCGILPKINHFTTEKLKAV